MLLSVGGTYTVAVETLDLIDDPVHILDRDIAHPSRRRPLLPPVERQLH